MADNIALPAASGNAATRSVTYSGDTAHAQVVGLVGFSGSDDAKTAADIPGDATNGLDVDVTRLPALPAGDNNIGNVDLVTVPAPLSTTGGGTEATALRVTVASDSTGVLSVDDNGAALTVDNGGTFAVQVDGSEVRQKIQSGVAGTVYKVRFQADAADGSRYVEARLLPVETA